MFNIYLVCSHGDKRIPEVLAGPGIHITLISCAKSQVRESKFVDRVILLTEHDSCAEFASFLIKDKDLISSIDGWVIFGRDDEMYEVSHSDLPSELKLKLLPVRNPDAMHVPGSKADFISFCKSAGVSIPRSEIFESQSALDTHFKGAALPTIIKSDRGSGGTAIRVVVDKSELDIAPIPITWFPVVAQQFIQGEPRGVDALFREGHLLAWMYCDNFQFPTEFGPSVSRRYVDPPEMDFEEDLVKFGKATGAHGFANCSFFYLPESNKHLMFEADLRTNAWHHFGKLFGLNWSAMMKAPLMEITREIHHPLNLPAEGVRIVLWQRYMEYAIQNRKWRIMFRLIRMRKNKRSPIAYEDEPINRAQFRGLFRLIPIAFAKFFFELLPISTRRKLKEGGATARFASRIAAG